MADNTRAARAQPPVPLPGAASATSNPASGTFRLEDYPFFMIALVDNVYNDQMAAVLRSIHMNRPRWRVLMALRQHSPRSISELATLAFMKLSTISRVVERLRLEGMVSCAPRASDNRVTEVYLEAPGREALAKIVTVASRVYERAVEGLSEHDVDDLLRVLGRIHDNLARSPLE